MNDYEPQQFGERICEDPTHDEFCDCGARPDHDYESQRVADHE